MRLSIVYSGLRGAFVVYPCTCCFVGADDRIRVRKMIDAGI